MSELQYSSFIYYSIPQSCDCPKTSTVRTRYALYGDSGSDFFKFLVQQTFCGLPPSVLGLPSPYSQLSCRITLVLDNSTMHCMIVMFTVSFDSSVKCKVMARERQRRKRSFYKREFEAESPQTVRIFSRVLRWLAILYFTVQYYTQKCSNLYFDFNNENDPVIKTVYSTYGTQHFFCSFHIKIAC